MKRTILFLIKNNSIKISPFWTGLGSRSVQMTIPMSENRKESDSDKLSKAKGVAQVNNTKFCLGYCNY